MTSILGYSAYVKTFFSFFKKTINFFPVSNEYFFTNIKFYYCISTLVHGSKSVKRGQAPLYQETSRKVN